MAKLTHVTPRADHKLFLEYDDGVSGEADLSHMAGKGVFAAWNDPAVFEAVSIGDHGEIRWTDDLEICSDAMYLQIAGKRPEDLFPSLKATADA